MADSNNIKNTTSLYNFLIHILKKIDFLTY